MKNIHHWIFTLKTFRHSYKHTKASTQSYSLLQYTQCLCTGSNSGAQCIHSNLLSVVGVMQGPFYLWRLTHLETRQDWCYVLLYYEINKKTEEQKTLNKLSLYSECQLWCQKAKEDTSWSSKSACYTIMTNTALISTGCHTDVGMLKDPQFFSLSAIPRVNIPAYGKSVADHRHRFRYYSALCSALLIFWKYHFKQRLKKSIFFKRAVFKKKNISSLNF